jgi:hypothetical protein
MRRSGLSYIIAGIFGMFVFSSAGNAEIIELKADLHGQNEVPPNQTAGSGAVTATYDTATKQLSWKGNFSGLTGDATASHFHGPAPEGKNAGFIVWISEKGQHLQSPFQGTATLTEEQGSDMLAGLWYVNVHTATNPGGELRGQLTKADSR